MWSIAVYFSNSIMVYFSNGIYTTLAFFVFDLRQKSTRGTLSSYVFEHKDAKKITKKQD